jgi:hypothetical protein
LSGAPIKQWAHILAPKFSPPKIDSRGRHGTLAQPHGSGNACRLGRMAHMNELRSRSKNSQVTASVYDSGRDAMIFEGFNSTVNREAFGDTSQVNDHPPAESNVVRGVGPKRWLHAHASVGCRTKV